MLHFPFCPPRFSTKSRGLVSTSTAYGDFVSNHIHPHPEPSFFLRPQFKYMCASCTLDVSVGIGKVPKSSVFLFGTRSPLHHFPPALRSHSWTCIQQLLPVAFSWTSSFHSGSAEFFLTELAQSATAFGLFDLQDTRTNRSSPFMKQLSFSPLQCPFWPPRRRVNVNGNGYEGFGAGNTGVRPLSATAF